MGPTHQKMEAIYLERYNPRTIDELGRLLLHRELRQKLCLEIGDEVSLKLIDTTIVVQKAEYDTGPCCTVCQISELGTIALPTEFRQQLGWKESDKVAMYHIDNMAILKLA